jgi:hypothetical protein
MLTLKARIETERASRYLVQFCKHAAAMGSGGHTSRMHLHGLMARRAVQVTAEWSDTDGTVTFTPWGRCTLAAEDSALTLLIEAADEDGLRQIQDVISRNFDRFSRRDPLALTWHRHELDAARLPEAETAPPRRRRGPLRSNLQTILLTLAMVVIIGMHVGLAGTVAANSVWTGMATNVVVALVLLKVALIALARFGIRRRKAAKTPDGT